MVIALEIMDGVKVALAVQHRAHALGRPALDLAAQIVEQPDEAAGTRRRCRPWRRRASRPADRCRRRLRLERRCGHSRARPGTAPTSDLARSKPTRAISVSASAAKPGSTKPVLRPEALAGETARLQAARPTSRTARDLARRRSARQARRRSRRRRRRDRRRARPPRRVHHRGGVPALAIGCGVGVAHSKPGRSDPPTCAARRT